MLLLLYIAVHTQLTHPHETKKLALRTTHIFLRTISHIMLACSHQQKV
jgi:hypothetical protein